jgi:hypothetical protein
MIAMEGFPHTNGGNDRYEDRFPITNVGKDAGEDGFTMKDVGNDGAEKPGFAPAGEVLLFRQKDPKPC